MTILLCHVYYYIIRLHVIQKVTTTTGYDKLALFPFVDQVATDDDSHLSVETYMGQSRPVDNMWIWILIKNVKYWIFDMR